MPTAMVKKKRKMTGSTRSRRPKTGENKRLLIQLSDEEKIQMEQAATKAGVSLSRYIVERALKAARKTLSE